MEEKTKNYKVAKFFIFVFISNMTPISFGANFIKNTYIKSRNENNDFGTKDASVVELDINASQDIDTMFDLCDIWNREGFNLVQDIITEATKDFENPDKIKEHYIVLTLQEDHFEKLNPAKILGISLLSESEYENEINRIQVKPITNNDSNPAYRQFKNVGKAMIDYIKEFYGGKSIYVNSAVNAVEFYKKNGFEQYDTSDPYNLHYYE